MICVSYTSEGPAQNQHVSCIGGSSFDDANSLKNFTCSRANQTGLTLKMKPITYSLSILRSNNMKRPQGLKKVVSDLCTNCTIAFFELRVGMHITILPISISPSQKKHQLWNNVAPKYLKL